MIGMLGIMGVFTGICAALAVVISAAVGISQTVQASNQAAKEAEIQAKEDEIAAKGRRSQMTQEQKNKIRAINKASLGNALARWKIRKMGYEARYMNRQAAMMNTPMKASAWQRGSYYGNA